MNLGIGLGVTNYLRVPTVAINPDDLIAALFDAGGGTFYEGAWYDPSDLTTLYQNAAGTTPVTGTGQPVGLMLDKSKGGIGATNELPSISASNWVPYGSNTVTDEPDGSVLIDYVDNSEGAFVRIHELYAGILDTSMTHVFRFDAKVSTGAVGVRLNGVATAALVNVTNTSYQSFELFARSSGSASFAFQALNLAAGESINIRNLSVYQVPGNHATQSTSTARPTLQLDGSSYYLDFDGVDDYMDTAYFATISQPITSAVAGTATANDFLLDGGPINTHSYYISNTADLAYFRTTGYSAGTAVADCTRNADHVFAGYANGSSSFLRIDAVETLTPGTGTGGITKITIAASGSASFPLDGRIYGALLVNRTLDPDEITSVESYLADKTGAFTAPVITGVPTISVS